MGFWFCESLETCETTSSAFFTIFSTPEGVVEMFRKLVGGGDANSPKQWRYEDLPSPVTKEEMLEVLEAERKVRQEWLEGTEADGWKKFGAVDGITIEELPIAGSSVHVVRARGILSGVDLEKIFDDFTNGGLEERRQISADILSHEMIYQMEDHVDVYISYSSFSTPMGVSNRDFLTLRNLYRQDDGKYLIVSQSINYEAKPFQAGNVRATTRNARLFEPIEGEERKYKVTLVDHVDPRGNVPGFVVNMFKKRAAEAIIKLQKAYGKGPVQPAE